MQPDDAARVRASIERQHRLGRRARLEAAESEIRSLKAGMRRLATDVARDMKELIDRAEILTAQVADMLRENRQTDDTTICMPAITPAEETTRVLKERRTRPFLD